MAWAWNVCSFAGVLRGFGPAMFGAGVCRLLPNAEPSRNIDASEFGYGELAPNGQQLLAWYPHTLLAEKKTHEDVFQHSITYSRHKSLMVSFLSRSMNQRVKPRRLTG